MRVDRAKYRAFWEMNSRSGEEFVQRVIQKVSAIPLDRWAAGGMASYEKRGPDSLSRSEHLRYTATTGGGAVVFLDRQEVRESEYGLDHPFYILVVDRELVAVHAEHSGLSLRTLYERVSQSVDARVRLARSSAEAESRRLAQEQEERRRRDILGKL